MARMRFAITVTVIAGCVLQLGCAASGDSDKMTSHQIEDDAHAAIFIRGMT